MEDEGQATLLDLFGDLSAAVQVFTSAEAEMILQRQMEVISLHEVLEELLGTDTYILDKVAEESRSARSCIKCGHATFWDFENNTCRNCRGV